VSEKQEKKSAKGGRKGLQGTSLTDLLGTSGIERKNISLEKKREARGGYMGFSETQGRRKGVSGK